MGITKTGVGLDMNAVRAGYSLCISYRASGKKWGIHTLINLRVG